MENFYLILTISGIHLLALISPGPDFVMVVKNSIQYSRKIGIFTSIGFSIGILVHLFYCIIGLSLILSTNELIYNIFKILCSGYLIYMGIKSFKDNQIGNSSKNTKINKISYLQAIKIGFLTNVLNPKVSLFFLSLFSLMITPKEIPFYILILLIIIIVTSTFIWFSLVAIFLTQKKVNNLFMKNFKYLNKIFGCLLILIAIRILLN